MTSATLNSNTLSTKGITFGRQMFFRWTRVRIHKIEDGHLTEVRDENGFITSGSRMENDVFPITQQTEEIAAKFMEKRQQLEAFQWANTSALNSYLVNCYEMTMRNFMAYVDGGDIDPYYQSTLSLEQDWYALINKMKVISYETYLGIKLVR